jgi:hypothetical protein
VLVIAAQLACLEAETKARNAEAEVRVRELLIEKMKFTIAKLRHERFGQSAERGAVLEQLELSLADMEEDASQAEAAAQLAANAAAGAKVTVAAFERRKPARRPFAMAHSFMPERKRDYRERKKVTWKGKDIYTTQGIEQFETDTRDLVEYLLQMAFGKKVADWIAKGEG